MDKQQRRMFTLTVALALAVITCALVVVFSYFFSSQQSTVGSQSEQESPKRQAQFRAVEPPPEPAPEAEGKAVGTIKPFKPARNLESSLLAHPAPDIWLVFPDPQGREPSDSDVTAKGSVAIRVALPAAAKRLLRDHWKATCAYYYTALASKSDQSSRIERRVARIMTNGFVVYKLSQLAIDAPGGRRNMTTNEAGKVVELLDKFADDLLSPFRGPEAPTA